MKKSNMATRFRGFFPVVVDLETGGFDADICALLEMAFVTLILDEEGMMHRDQTFSCHVLPFPRSKMDPKCLAVNKIDPYHPFRFAVEENQALIEMFTPINQAIRKNGCHKAVLVGHNACFDLNFLQAAVNRCHFKKNPFHAFTTFDTATLSAMAFGETILAKAALAAGLGFDPNEAHSAIYDAEKTADLFCKIMNLWNASKLG
jgi:ribonuclease T